MKLPDRPNLSVSNAKRVITWTALVVIVFVAGFWIVHLFQNPATDIVNGIGKTLVARGAIAECGNGDNGFGPDNNAPHFGRSYALPVGKDEAVKMVYAATSDHGYQLTHASPTNRGHLSSIADAFIDNWYFDDTKTSSSIFIKPGFEKLAVSIQGPGEKDACTQLPIAPGHSVVGVGVELPDRRF